MERLVQAGADTEVAPVPLIKLSTGVYCARYPLCRGQHEHRTGAGVARRLICWRPTEKKGRIVAMQALTWDDIEPAARDAFNIWTSGSDFEWAKEAWALLAKAELCNYDTERERHVVIARFLALASLYRDWCSLVFGETQEDTPGYWVEGLEVNPIYLGQLVPDEELSDDPSDAIWDAWQLLLGGERPVVAKALRTGYGGSVEDLFLALWRSVKGSWDLTPGDEDYVQESDADILNDATGEKLAGYSWIQEGCPNVRP